MRERETGGKNLCVREGRRVRERERICVGERKCD